MQAYQLTAETTGRLEAYLQVATYFLFARKALVAVTLAVVPETLIVRLTAPDMSRCDMRGELITGCERLQA